MSVSSVKLAFTGTTGKISRGGKAEYTAHYDVRVDDKQDNIVAISNYFLASASLPHPDKATTYAYGNDADLRAICDSLDARKDAASDTLWRVAVHFGDDQDTEEGEDEQGNPTDDPLEFAPEITHRISKTKRPVWEAEYISGFRDLPNRAVDTRVRAMQANNGGTIVPMHSALVPFDPPLERDAAILILSITANVTGQPFYIGTDAFRYVNQVNSQDFTVQASNYFLNVPFIDDTYGGAARISDIHPVRKRQGGIVYWQVTTEMEIDFKYGWRAHVVDRGMNRRQCEGDPDGFGGTISAVDLQPGMARNAPIKDITGVPITEPVLLDGAGQPLDHCSEDPVWITYRIYDEFRFQNAFGLGWEGIIT